MAAQKGRNAERTRKALMDTALGMFQQFGYEKTGLNRIGAELGISGPAIYYHFKSKSQLLVAAYRRRMEAMLEAQQAMGAGMEVEEQLWTFVALHVRLQFGADQEAHYSGPYCYGVAQLKMLCKEEDRGILTSIQNKYVKFACNLIQKGVDDGTFQRLDPTATAFAIFGMNNNAGMWFRPGNRISMAELSFMHADFALSLVGCKLSSNRNLLIKLVNQAVAGHEFPDFGKVESI